MIGYFAGFATGTWAGVWLETKVPIGVASVQAFTSEAGSGVAAALRSLAERAVPGPDAEMTLLV